MLELFRGACLAVRAMHTYRPSKKSAQVTSDANPNSLATGTSSMQPPSRPHSPAPEHEHDAHESHTLLNHPSSHDNHDEIHADDGEGEGYSYPQGASVPQVIDRMESGAGANEVVFDGDEELARKEGTSIKEEGDILSYAHRDIKPAYVDPALPFQYSFIF